MVLFYIETRNIYIYVESSGDRAKEETWQELDSICFDESSEDHASVKRPGIADAGVAS